MAASAQQESRLSSCRKAYQISLGLPSKIFVTKVLPRRNLLRCLKRVGPSAKRPGTLIADRFSGPQQYLNGCHWRMNGEQMVWVKAVHIVAIVIWSASLIYLPILMAGHSPRLSNPEYLRLHGMVRRIYLWIASPFALFAIISGTVLIPLRNVTEPWFAVKLLVVALLAIIHARCGTLLAKQSHSAERANRFSRTMRILMPVLLFPCVLWLVLAKPRLPFDRAHPLSVPVKSESGERVSTPLLPLPSLRKQAYPPAIRPPRPEANPAPKVPSPMARAPLWGRTSV